MFNKLKSLLVVFMLVLISACVDFDDLDNKDKDPVAPETNQLIWDGTTFTEVTPNGTVYEINLPSEFAWIAQESLTRASGNYAGKTIKLMADLDMGDKLFTGIKSFAGKLDGNNKKITNLKIGESTIDNIGLINVLEEGGHIENLTIASGTITGKSNVGAFVGKVSGSSTFIGVKNNATVKAGSRGVSCDKVGGLIGTGNGKGVVVTITDSSNSGTIGNCSSLGGIIGYSKVDLTITNSSNTGTINSDFQVGGLVGQSDGDLIIKNSFNSGTIKGHIDIGGLVGLVTLGDVEIDNSSNYSDLGDLSTGGGILGDSTATSVKITRSSNYGDMSGDGGEKGGIIGKSSSALTIENCSNNGSIVSDAYDIGGIIGKVEAGTALVKNTFSYAKSIKGVADSVGGIVGGHSNGAVTATNSYWLYELPTTGTKEPNGTVLSGGSYNGASSNTLNTTKFKATTNFKGWDFTDNTGIWIMGTEYPTLRNLPKP